MLYRPSLILAIGWLVWGAVFWLSPLQPRVDLQPGSITFILTASLAFVVGDLFSKLTAIAKSRQSLNSSRIREKEIFLFRIFFSLGAVGITFRLIDMFAIRGISGFGMGAREALADSSSSIFGIVGAVLYPFAYLPLLIYLSSHCLERNRRRLHAATILFLMPAVVSIVLFSRSSLLLSAAFLYLSISLIFFNGRAIPRRIILPAMAAVAFVGGVSAFIFSLRLEDMQLDLVFSMFESGYAYTVAPNDTAVDLMDNEGIVGTILTNTLPILQYYTHGFFEFQIMWEGARDQVFSNGALLLAPYVKLLNIFGIAQSVNLYDLFPRVGVFSTFFGPLWVDFGWISPVVMLFFGFFAGRIAKSAKSRDYSALPLHIHFSAILFFSPIVNFAISAQGMYLITAFVVFRLAAGKTARSRILDMGGSR